MEDQVSTVCYLLKDRLNHCKRKLLSCFTGPGFTNLVSSFQVLGNQLVHFTHINEVSQGLISQSHLLPCLPYKGKDSFKELHALPDSIFNYHHPPWGCGPAAQHVRFARGHPGAGSGQPRPACRASPADPPLAPAIGRAGESEDRRGEAPDRPIAA